MGNTETLVTLGTQDTGHTQTKHTTYLYLTIILYTIPSIY